MSGLSPGANSKTLYAVEDSFYNKSRFFTINISRSPAIVKEATNIVDYLGALAATETNDEFDADDLAAMINDDGTVNIDQEGIAMDDNCRLPESQILGALHGGRGRRRGVHGVRRARGRRRGRGDAGPVELGRPAGRAPAQRRQQHLQADRRRTQVRQVAQAAARGARRLAKPCSGPFYTRASMIVAGRRPTTNAPL